MGGESQKKFRVEWSEKAKKKPGPSAERLKLRGDWQALVGKALAKKRGAVIYFVDEASVRAGVTSPQRSAFKFRFKLRQPLT